MALRILIVEDEALIALDLADILESAGHQVVGTAGTMAEALKLAAKTKPQVAIVDMTLQGRADGIETAVALGEGFGLPVMFLTGTGAFMVRAMALDIEPIAYVLKPYKPEDVLLPLAGLARPAEAAA